MKKILSILLAVLLCFSFSVPVFAANVVASGYCGKNPKDLLSVTETATWTVYDDGRLVFAPTNGNQDVILKNWFLGPNDTPPWLDYEFDEVILEEGIAEIGSSFSLAYYDNYLPVKKVIFPTSLKAIHSRAFGGFENLREIYIPEGVEDIGNDTFRDCSLSTVYIPSTIKLIFHNAFLNNPIKDVYFGGTEAEWEALMYGPYGNTGLIESHILDSNPTIHFNAKNNHPLMHLAPNPAPNPADGASDWAKDEVNSAINADLVPENLQENYQKAVTRGEVAKMFCNLLEKSTGKSINEILAENTTLKRGTFSDTSDPDVLAMNALDIINGVGNNRFDPNGSLTRSQAAALINRVARTMGIKTDGFSHSFTDVKGHWVDKELGFPVHVGIIYGVGDRRFDPDSPLTTEQAILIVYRAYVTFQLIEHQ